MNANSWLTVSFWTVILLIILTLVAIVAKAAEMAYPLPDAQVGVYYHQTLVARYGTKPYTWGLRDGKLPDGLTLDSANGVISGVSTVEGSFSFTLTVTDAKGAATGMFVSLSVAPALEPAIRFLTVTLADGNTGAASCSPTVTSNCIYGWNIYDVTGTRTFIGYVPVSASNLPGGNVSGTLPWSNPAVGQHRIVANVASKEAGGVPMESVDSPSTTFQVE